MPPPDHGTSLMLAATKSGPRILDAAAKHNLRVITGAHIDEALSIRNRILHGPDTPREITGLAHERMLAAGINPKTMRSNGTRMAEIIVGLPSSSPVDSDAYFRATLAWVVNQFGSEAVLSAVVHLDESHPHCHVLMLPMRHGVWKASRVIGLRSDLAKLQDDFFRTVASRFGVRRAPKKLKAKEMEAGAQAVLDELKRRDAPELRGPLWPRTRDDIKRNPRPYAELLGIEIKRELKTLAQLAVSEGRGSTKSKCYSTSCVGPFELLCTDSSSTSEPPRDMPAGFRHAEELAQ